jgi:hypothetical protein
MVGEVFNNKQIEGLEDHKPVNESNVDWELDDYTLQRFRELGLDKLDSTDDGSEFISRI